MKKHTNWGVNVMMIITGSAFLALTIYGALNSEGSVLGAQFTIGFAFLCLLAMSYTE